MTLIVNMFGGPGSGKSTQAAGLFYKLKMRSINCELITEKAKDLTWEKNFTALGNQFFVSAHQVYRQEMLEGQVDCLITDCPILLGVAYDQTPNKYRRLHLKNYLLATFNEKDNFNVYVRRKNKYTSSGRNQNAQEAERIDEEILNFLDMNKIPIRTIDGTQSGLEELFQYVCRSLRSNGINI